jgi:hypothetical protein
MTTDWDRPVLDTLASTDEVGISSFRADGTLRPYVTIWAVVADGGVYVRSAYGAGNGWYRRAVASGSGRLRLRGVEHDVTFEQPEDAVQQAVDQAYRDEYGAAYPSIVRGIVGPDWYGVTLRLDPGRQDTSTR